MKFSSIALFASGAAAFSLEQESFSKQEYASGQVHMAIMEAKHVRIPHINIGDL